MKTHSHKTLGPVSSKLITTLLKEGQVFFRLADVQRILNKTERASADLISELVKRRIAARLKPGLFLIIPLEADRNYRGNLLLTAAELAHPHPYYIAYYSAMAVHGMTTHPVKDIFIASTARRKNRQIGPAVFLFQYTQKKRLFGLTDHWATPDRTVKISDPERTIIDALARPELCGGISEITKGLWIRRKNIDLDSLCRYTKKLQIHAVTKRLGFLLEHLKIADQKTLTRLQRRAARSQAYVPLEPGGDNSGRHISRWKLRINIPIKEIEQTLWH
ncbi:MAG: type IV toxin-antitoxin system AbiEi family antitoxin [Candidatus Omnitrophota bacterium]